MQKINITAKDGTKIPTITLGLDDKKKKAIIIISHGFGEHSGSYIELAEHLQKAGHASIIPDQRGHGKPPEGEKKWHGIIAEYQCFIDDIITLTDYAREIAPETPIVLYGHSMGGNIVINTVLRSFSDVSLYICAVLESPWLGLYKPLSPLEVCLVKLLSRITPNFIKRTNLEHNDLSSDAEKAVRYSEDDLYHNFISVRMLTGILDGCDYAIENAENFPVPAFLAYAENDHIVCNEAIHEFVAKAGDIVTKEGYESNHAIHNDKNWEAFIHDMISFIDSCLQPAK